MKKVLIFMFAMMLGVSGVKAESGTCGDNLTWTLEDSVLTIEGTGKMRGVARCPRKGGSGRHGLISYSPPLPGTTFFSTSRGQVNVKKERCLNKPPKSYFTRPKDEVHRRRRQLFDQ